MVNANQDWKLTWTAVDDGEYVVSRDEREPFRFNIYQRLFEGSRSPFRGVDPGLITLLLDGAFETCQETPSFRARQSSHPGNNFTREGFLVELAGKSFDYFYFCLPGAIVLTNPWRKSMEPKYDNVNLPFRRLSQKLGSPVYINGLRGHCKPIAVLRNMQLAGLLEHSLQETQIQAMALQGGLGDGLKPSRWLANVFVGNSSRLFRIHRNTLLSKISQSSVVAKFEENIRRELIYRMAEGHLSRLFSIGNSDHLNLAKHLLDYAESSGLEEFEGNQYRIEFYSGVDSASLKSVMERLIDFGAISPTSPGPSRGHARYQLNIPILSRLVSDWDKEFLP